MAADNPNFPTLTASVSWLDSSGTAHLRVYSSDGYNVTERCYDGDGWTDGAFSQPGSHVSATCWSTSAGSFIRVYCTGSDTTIEWCADAGSASWYQGAYTTS